MHHNVLWTPSLTDSAPFCSLGCFNGELTCICILNFALIIQHSCSFHSLHGKLVMVCTTMSCGHLQNRPHMIFLVWGHFFCMVSLLHFHTGLSGINCTTSFLLPLPLRPRKAMASTVIVPQACFRAFGHTSLGKPFWHLHLELGIDHIIKVLMPHP